MFGNLAIVGWFGTGAGGSGTVTTINVDLTGNVTGIINLAGQSGNLIINVTTTDANKTVNGFINATLVDGIVLRPDATLAPLTTNDAITSGNPTIKLNAPTLPVYGNFKGFLQLEKRGTVFYQIDYIDQYNS